MRKIISYSDGASRGNPGKAAIGVVLVGENKKILREHSQAIGIATNNQAEYRAIIKALELAQDYAGEVDCFLDSELIVKQLNGEYKTKNLKLRELKRVVRHKEEAFTRVTYKHVSRTDPFIQRADELANLALDAL
ncbi:MAG TPA: ribonuclease HI family protein [Euryarchaeota archaeon]|nr:14.7 kDa ribonuclease H-like protein [archaeon BMS3Bbin15]HDL15905.1 ribonuclease HI family protein [Euryarchaeota archaeon]